MQFRLFSFALIILNCMDYSHCQGNRWRRSKRGGSLSAEGAWGPAWAGVSRRSLTTRLQGLKWAGGCPPHPSYCGPPLFTFDAPERCRMPVSSVPSGCGVPEWRRAASPVSPGASRALSSKSCDSLAGSLPRLHSGTLSWVSFLIWDPFSCLLFLSSEYLP